MKLCIVGGGASGLMAAITAASIVGKKAEIFVLEGGQKPGRKILSTGNGHCNLTNLKESPAAYHSDSTYVCTQVLSSFGAQETIEFFNGLGIPCVSRDGYVYPKNKEAASVREALLSEALRLGVNVMTETKAEYLELGAEGFILKTADGRCFTADRVILAAGGMAFPKSGSDGSGYSLAMDLGHSLIQPLPALVALTAEENFCKALAGIRIDAAASLYVNNIRKKTEQGEIQLTDYGISGIPVFQLSGDAVEALCGEKEVKVQLNLWDGKSETDVLYELKMRIKARPMLESGEVLRGIVPDKMIPVLLKLSGIELHVPAESIRPAELAALSKHISSLVFTVNGAKDFDSAQVTRGGIPLAEVDRDLQSRFIPGLFFAGEILNVDGICGGYNLQWAWASGHTAGIAAVK